MPIPILKHGEILVASIQVDPGDRDLLQLRDELLALVGRHRSRGVVVDVTALDILDSFAVRTLRGIAHVTQLRGASTVVVGIQPDVAYSLVQLGLNLDEMRTALDLEEGLDLLLRGFAGDGGHER